jgi:chemotaxis protein methyltransferase CheR
MAVDPTISPAAYEAVRALIRDRIGIELGPGKQTMVSGRLQARLLATKTPHVEAYLAGLDDDPDEFALLLDAISTNTTSFWREPRAFEFFQADLKTAIRERRHSLRIWSAASSTGMEAYTLAILLAEAGLLLPPWDVRILATDISTRVLAACREATYNAPAMSGVPEPFRGKYFTKVGKGWQVVGPLRRLITVNRLNLFKPPYPMQGPFDVIFCRNVMIYFPPEVRQVVVDQCAKLLRPGGLFCIGAAESLNGLKHGFKTLAPSIFRA